jgi:hypothetical protein
MIPNWKEHGFKNKEEGIMKAIGNLMASKKIGKGIDGNPLTVKWNNMLFNIGLGKKNEKHK